MKNLNQYMLESLKISDDYGTKNKEQLPENCARYFFNRRVNVDEIEDFDTSNVTDMSSMFNQASFNGDSLDLVAWDVSNVEDMNSMFYYCDEIKKLDLSNWDTSNVKTIEYMFDHCKYLEFLDVSNWDTSKIIADGTVYTFNNCYRLNDIRFGPGWFKSKNMRALDLSSCCDPTWSSKKISNETYESMLTMYDRKSNGFKDATIYFNGYIRPPKGWKEKMEDLGYSIKKDKFK